MSPCEKSLYKQLHKMIFQLELHNSVEDWYSRDDENHPAVSLKNGQLELFGLGLFGDPPQYATWRMLMEKNNDE